MSPLHRNEGIVHPNAVSIRGGCEVSSDSRQSTNKNGWRMPTPGADELLMV